MSLQTCLVYWMSLQVGEKNRRDLFRDGLDFFCVAFKKAFFHEAWKIYCMKTINFDRIMKAHRHGNCELKKYST